MEKKQVIERLNAALFGQHGIIVKENQPKYLGTLRSVELLKSSNILFTFSEHTVNFSAWFPLIFIVKDSKKKDGPFGVGDDEMYDQNSLYVGDKSLIGIIRKILEDEA